MWYQATATRPRDPAVIHGKVLVPPLMPRDGPVMRIGFDQVTFAGLVIVAGFE